MTNTKQKRQVVVILGVGAGMGKALVYSFAKSKSVVYFSSRGTHFSDEFFREIKSINEDVYYIRADCSKYKDIDRLSKKILNKEKRIDILVVNTGRWISKPLDRHTFRDYDELVNSNFKVHFLVYKSFAKYFKRQRSGMIFSVVGVYGTRFIPENQSVYNATKAACFVLSKTFAQEMAPYNVRLFIISPGVTSHTLFSTNPAEELGTIRELKRDGLPEDVALFIEKIASFPEIFATGTVFEIAGIKSSTIY